MTTINGSTFKEKKKKINSVREMCGWNNYSWLITLEKMMTTGLFSLVLMKKTFGEIICKG